MEYYDDDGEDENYAQISMSSAGLEHAISSGNLHCHWNMLID
jgi:hypothetical protein